MDNHDTTEVPEELREPFSTVVRWAEFRGQPQLESSRDGYKLVINPPRNRRLERRPEEGDVWLLRAERACGNIIFCYPERLMANHEGVHPVIAATANYIMAHNNVQILVEGRTFVEGPIKDVEQIENGLRFTYRSGRTFNIQDEHFVWKWRQYSRYIGEGYVQGRGRVKVVFYEFGD